MGTDARWADTMPAAYDELLGPALFAPFARELTGRAARLRPASVLELAAGPGILTEELVARLPGVAVTATDLHPSMVGTGPRGCRTGTPMSTGCAPTWPGPG